MNPDQLAQALGDTVVLLEKLVEAVPGGGECPAADLIDYLRLARTNDFQLRAVHRTLEGQKQAAPLRRQA